MVANQRGTEVGYLAGRYPGSIGHLYSPGAECGPYPFLPYSTDNGCFVRWDEAAWRRLLNWAALSGQRPLWSLAPDVVSNREGTLALWREHVGTIRRFGFRPALAIQDGMTFADVPDSECMLFIGGGDEFKDAAIRPWCERFPGRVHVGRVNDHERLLRCYHAGAVSVDGTGWFRNNARAKRTGSETAGVLLRKFIEETHARKAA